MNQINIELEKLTEVLVPFFEVQKRLSEDVMKTVRLAFDIIEPFPSFKIDEKILNEISNSLGSIVSHFLELVDSIDTLTKDGWYISTKMFDWVDSTSYFAKTINNWNKPKTKKEFAQRISKVFYEHFDSIKLNLISSNEKRKKIINVLFDLHEKKNYIAAIPLALMQVDGMCKDLIDSAFYSIRSSKANPNLKEKIDRKFPDKSIDHLIFHQISADNDNFILIKSKNEKMNELNRHSILHGESVDYGTEENSIKAILLLDFVRDFCERYNKNNPH